MIKTNVINNNFAAFPFSLTYFCHVSPLASALPLSIFPFKIQLSLSKNLQKTTMCTAVGYNNFDFSTKWSLQTGNRCKMGFQDKYLFSFFEPFCPNLALKFANSYNFLKIFIQYQYHKMQNFMQSSNLLKKCK